MAPAAVSQEEPAGITVCTPLTWMMPSTARSAFVFKWMKVSVPLVNQLIWPGAVKPAVSMKVKAWLPSARRGPATPLPYSTGVARRSRPGRTNSALEVCLPHAGAYHAPLLIACQISNG